MGRRTETDLIAKPSRQDAKRALRAHHKRRMKKKARETYPDMDPQRAERLADHIKICSCPWCCGNPRALYGDSFHDIRAKRALPLDPVAWE